MSKLSDSFSPGYRLSQRKRTPVERLKDELDDIDQVRSAEDADEVRRYVDTILRPLLQPNGIQLSGAQELALLELIEPRRGFIDGDGSGLAFRFTSRLVVGLQLVGRVIEPTRIRQHEHALCGPVTLMQDFVRRQPLGYVRYVIGLAEDRRGRLGLALAGGEPIREVKIPAVSRLLGYRRPLDGTGLAEADYIALASLRNTRNLLPYGGRTLQGATTPTTMKLWMKQMGYSSPKYHVLNRIRSLGRNSASAQQYFRRHIEQASQEIATGRSIFLCGAGDLGHHQIQDHRRDSRFMAAFGGHWMLCRAIDLQPDGVRFALDTWGQSSEISTAPKLTWTEVVSWYRGYISGMP